jgi:hypothetical protein
VKVRICNHVQVYHMLAFCYSLEGLGGQLACLHTVSRTGCREWMGWDSLRELSISGRTVFINELSVAKIV